MFLLLKWLSLFPIHAAGDYSSGPSTPDSPCVCDHVVSSYIPSLLVYSHMQARSKSLKASNYPSEPLLVGMPRTPHLENVQDLNVGAELSAVRKSLGTQMSPDNTPLISPSFACHSVAESQDPSKSALLLMDWKQKPLNVRALLRMTLQNCNLAFLSACESALNKDLGLRDEGIHIAGAFHMAGVLHTVATMWMVGDDIASEIAGLFYEGLGRKDGRIDWDTALQALHDAVQKLKRRGTLPILWGTFIHSGP
jgi:CHAT domain